MSFIRKYRMAFEMAGSPPQPSSAEIEVPLGVFAVAPIHQYGRGQNGTFYCQSLQGFRNYFLGPLCYKNCRGSRKGLRVVS